MPTRPPVRFSEGQQIDEFVVKRVTPLETLYAVAYEIEHRPSGARLLHIHCPDSENLFCVTFATPPPDDSGVPHILEHSVLAGSRKFPVKEPFFEMIKISMATFINAMTGPDCTYYPVASNVKQDLFNLAEVYFDAVFHPLLTPQTFGREGHHLAPQRPGDATGPLTVSGIVYNEMKGVFSNPEMLLYRRITQRLLADTIYGRESGGEPEAIAQLTHQGLVDFHRAHYHPGNAYFLLYGDIPTEEYLSFLRDKLREFKSSAVPNKIGRQVRWTTPRQAEETYPVDPREPQTAKTYLAMNWIVGDAADPRDTVLVRLLGLVLLGNDAAPLKKAIIDSGLGADLVYSGDSAVGIENVFQIILKGSEGEKAEAFAKLVLDTLEGVAARGLPAEHVEAAFQQAAYQYLEIQPMYPLHVATWVLQTWIYGGDPLAFLRMGEHLRACREQFRSNPQFLGQLIRSRLLDNPHRLLTILRPDGAMQERLDGQERDRLARLKEGMTAGQLGQVVEEARQLDELNSQSNSPEALASLPQLRVTDLPRKLSSIATTVEPLGGGMDLLYNDVFANGVSYLNLAIDLRGLGEDLWLHLPAYSGNLAKLGAAGQSYEQIAQRLAACTGGISCHPWFDVRADDPARPVWRLRLGLKALDEQMGPALQLLSDLLFGLDPRDPKRLRDLLVQGLAAQRTNVIQNGHVTAASHAARNMNPQAWLGELVGGLPQLRLGSQLEKDFDAQADGLMARIEAIRDFMLAGQVTASFTGSRPCLDLVRRTLVDWQGRSPKKAAADAPIGFEPHGPLREGLAGPTQVSYCCQVMPAPRYCSPQEPLLALGTHLVSMDYVLNEVRLKGNAYGAWLRYNPFGGMMSLGSYRDPHVARTLGAFGGTIDFVRQVQWSQTDIDHAIIANAKLDERPLRPAEATSVALIRHLLGLTQEIRQQRYERLLAATPAPVRQATLEALESGWPRSAVCVVSSREKLQDANAQMPDSPLAIEDVLT